MERALLVVMTIVVVIGALAVVPGAGFAQPAPSPDASIAATAASQQAGNPSAANGTDVSAGAMLSGAIGVQSAELDGEIEQRAFAIEVARAASNDSKADVLAEKLGDVEEQLDALEQRKDALEAARENGSISNATYGTKMTEVTARTATVEELANTSEAVASELPADLLESKGINVTAIETLKQNASELTGPEVAAIAQSIAGPEVGQPIDRQDAPGLENVPGDIGPGAADNRTAGNGSNGADTGQDRAEGDRGSAGNESASDRWTDEDGSDRDSENESDSLTESDSDDLEESDTPTEDEENGNNR